MRLLTLLPLLLLTAARAQPVVIADAEVADPTLAHGESIRVRYTLTNTGADPYRTTTSSSCVVGVTLGPVALPTACTADSVPFVLEPGQRIHYDWTLDPADLGVPETDGTHTIWVHLGVSWGMDPADAQLAASARFQAPAYRGGPLAVGFDVANAATVDTLRAKIGGEVLASTTYRDQVWQDWQVTGTVLADAIRRLEESGAVRYAERSPRWTPPRVTAAGGGPTAAWLSPPAPNPTAGPAALTLRLGAPAAVTVDVIDALGRRVAVLHDGPLAGGTDHTFRVAGGALSPGVYTVRVSGAGVRRSQRLVVAR